MSTGTGTGGFAAGSAGRTEGAAAAVRSDASLGIDWNEWFQATIADPSCCPLCMRAAIVDGICSHCAADLRGEAGERLMRASQQAAESLRTRAALLCSVTRVGAQAWAPPGSAPAAASASAAAAGSPRAGAQASRDAAAAPRANATLQSMFALAGAGLVAVAAIVFTFFNPDLENRVLRSAIVGVVTLLFLGSAWWLAKRGARLSAEALGGLGALLAGIDVWALAQTSNDGRDAWLLAAGATLLCALAALRLSARAGLRSWSFSAMLGFALVPAMLGYACAAASRPGASGGVWPVLGHLGTVLVIAALFEWLPRLRADARLHAQPDAQPHAQLGALPSAQPDSPALVGAPERAMLSALQMTAALVSIPMLAAALATGRAVQVAALLLGFAVTAVLAARHRAPAFWSLVAGAAGAAVLPALGLGVRGLGVWQLTLVTVSAAGGAVLVALCAELLAPRLRAVRRPQLMFAALAVPALFALPTAAFLLVGLFSSLHPEGEPGSSWNVELPWSFAANGLVLAAGSGLYARLARTARAGRYPSLRVLDALCAIVSVLFAMLAGLLVVRSLLDGAGCTGIARESLVASAGLSAAIIVTVAVRVSARVWGTVLAVATVPFIASVAAVVGERNGWTALTTACMFVLALTLLFTRRPGLGRYPRAAAAALLVPSLSVLLVCLGAEVLAASASPVVLPLIAAVVALALAGSGRVFARAPQPVALLRLAFEASALVTGAIAVLLSLVREAAGLGTACIVLLIIGVGALLLARSGGRGYGWWLAGASFAGALWCVLGLAEVAAFEAYLLPPTLSAALLAMWRSSRGSRQSALYAAALGASILPVLAMLAVSDEFVTARAIGLLIAAWALLGVGALLLTGRIDRVLAVPTFAAAMVAGIAGAVFGARLGDSGALFITCFAVSALGAAAMLGAALGLRAAAPRLRDAAWPEIPAAVALAAGCWWAIDRDWLDIWSMWALMLGYLIVMVVVVRRQLDGRGPRIPAAALFAIALATAIVAWSPRELRVDVFSLPLGLMLTVAGALALHRGGLEPAGGIGARSTARGDDALPGRRSGPVGRLARWPLGYRGSWPLLGPGITVTVLASILSTFTDPQTWRAILVMVIALVAMLVGARLRLAAPFVLGLVVLPAENVSVFAVQIGRGIDSMPWWITLATIGAVLLSIAVVAEQRDAERRTLMGRVRDLR